MNRLSALFAMVGSLWIAPLFAQVSLSSELIDVTDEGARYRVYAEVPEGALVQTLYADGSNPLSLASDDGIFQADGEAVLIEGDDADAVDSWFTIGLPAGNNGLATTGGVSWTAGLAAFEAGEAFSVTDAFGGAFYLLPSSNQGAEVEGQVLLGQFVSTSSVTLSLNLQWKTAPGQPSQYAQGLSIELSPSTGCTDATALNYNEDAIQDDGSCVWEEAAFDGLSYEVSQQATAQYPPTYRIYALMSNPNESVVSWYGLVDSPLSLTSSTDFFQSASGAATHPGAGDLSEAYFRDSWVTVGDTNSAYVLGLDVASFEAGEALTSDTAFGGAVAVTPGDPQSFPNAQGKVLLAQVTTAGEVNLTTNLKFRLADGESVDEFGLSLTIPASGLAGCTDEDACNYAAGASADDGSCTYPDAQGNCDGNCTSDADGDGVCDADEIPGCTDPQAPNFLPQATDDDGSCLSQDDSVDPVDGFLGLVQEATPDNTSDLMVHRVYAQFDGAGYEVLAMFGTGEAPLKLEADAGFIQDPLAGPLATDLPAVGAAPTDSWLTLGGDGPGTVDLYTVGIDFDAFENGGNLMVDAGEGGAIFIIPGSQPAAVSGADGRVLLAQLASPGTVNVTLNLKVATPGGATPEIMDLQLVVPAFVPGCTDAMACNFSANATLDDGSCTYIDGPCETCEDGQIHSNDADGDGVCDADETDGCTDAEACNYNPNATEDDGSCEYLTCEGCTDAEACNYDMSASIDNGSCTYAEEGLDCQGACLNDADGDGICDENEIAGCTDTTACNYDPTATDDDGNCTFVDGVCETCVDGVIVDNDADHDGVCNADETEGCTDTLACNYNDLPTLDSDNSQCVYAEACEVCSGATDGSGTVIDDPNAPHGCTYEVACNYDPAACVEDGSCEFAEPGRDCYGLCIWDFNGDGVCDEPGSGGCTYPSALNYDETAPYDDGTCEFRTGNCAFDNNEDGEVDVIDLLDMLVALGTYCD